MAITYDVGNISAQIGSKTAAITVIDPSMFSPPATDITRNRGTVTTKSTYRYKGSAWAMTELEVRHTVQPPEPGSLNVRHTVRLSTMVRRTNTAITEYDYIPYEAVIQWNTDSRFELQVAEMSRLIQAAVSLALGVFDGTSGAPSNAPVTSSALGITQSLT